MAVTPAISPASNGVPGMNHCGSGPSTDQFDMLTPLVQWVEKGVAPDRVIANVRAAGQCGRGKSGAAGRLVGHA